MLKYGMSEMNDTQEIHKKLRKKMILKGIATVRFIILGIRILS